MHDLRSQFCIESRSTIQELNLKKEEFVFKITALEEVDALEDLKDQFPDIQFRIEQLRLIKIKEIESLKPQIKAISSLILYFRE